MYINKPIDLIQKAWSTKFEEELLEFINGDDNSDSKKDNQERFDPNLVKARDAPSFNPKSDFNKRASSFKPNK